MAASRVRERAPRQSERRVVTLFVVYLVLLAWMVLWKLDLPYIGAAAGLPRPTKLIPFAPSAEAGGSAPLEVLANVALFVPFGLYLGLLASSWKWWKATCVFAGASVVFESTQHLISTGSFDSTDVVTNSAGGLLGLAMLTLLRRRLGERATTVVARAMMAATAICVVAIGVYLASPLRYAPQHDVIVPWPSVSD